MMCDTHKIPHLIFVHFIFLRYSPKKNCEVINILILSFVEAHSKFFFYSDEIHSQWWYKVSRCVMFWCETCGNLLNLCEIFQIESRRLNNISHRLAFICLKTQYALCLKRHYTLCLHILLKRHYIDPQTENMFRNLTPKKELSNNR